MTTLDLPAPAVAPAPPLRPARLRAALLVSARLSLGSLAALGYDALMAP